MLRALFAHHPRLWNLKRKSTQKDRLPVWITWRIDSGWQLGTALLMRVIAGRRVGCCPANASWRLAIRRSCWLGPRLGSVIPAFSRPICCRCLLLSQHCSLLSTGVCFPWNPCSKLHVLPIVHVYRIQHETVRVAVLKAQQQGGCAV